MNSPRITYTPRPDATAQGELDTLPTVYKFILDCHAKKKAAETAPKPDTCNDAAIVTNTEGVTHVDQQPHRPSEITIGNR
jgi:hypothetical protein